MTVESYLESKLKKFSILDIALIKSVYFVSGLLICLLYPVLKIFEVLILNSFQPS